MNSPIFTHVRCSGARAHAFALMAATVLMVAASLLIGTGAAYAAAPFWHIGSETAPTNLPPGGEGLLIVHASNLGDAPIDGTATPVVVADTLSPDS